MDENRTYEIIRYVSKCGDLELVSDSTIEWARSLESPAKVALYCRVRDGSRRLESEWRAEFIEKVRVDPGSLPPPLEEPDLLGECAG